jgi:pimeloyl-ACP methyl ester carboxylesterase
VLSINNADERRCSDDKSRRWNCGHYTGQRKTHLFRRGDGRRAHRGVGRILDADLRKDLGNIQVPTLILHWVNDHACLFDLAKVMHENIKGSQLVSIEKSSAWCLV